MPPNSLQRSAASRRHSIPNTPEEQAEIDAYLARTAKKPNKSTESKRPAAPDDKPPTPPFKVWWNTVKVWYDKGEAGADEKHTWADTVCQRVALRAMMNQARDKELPVQCGTGFNLECSPVSAGWQAAKALWHKYDPAKDNGGGIEAFLYETAKWNIWNAAWIEFAPSGKRKHAKGEILPEFQEHRDDAIAHTQRSLAKKPEASPDTYGRSTPAAKVEYDVTDEDLTECKLEAEDYDHARNPISIAANKAEHIAKKDFKATDAGIEAAPQLGTVAPAGRALLGPLELQEDGSWAVAVPDAIRLDNTLEAIPRRDVALLAATTGALGYEKASSKELAKTHGSTEAAMLKRISRLRETLREKSGGLP